MKKDSDFKRVDGGSDLSSDLNQGKFSRFVSFIRRMQTIYVLIFFVVVLILTLLAASFAFSEEKFGKLPTCGDGTFYNTCSLDKPYYCQEGVLIEKATTCGCAGDLTRSGDSCISEYHSNQKSLSFRYFFEGHSREIDFSVYEGGEDYVSSLSRVISYSGSESPSRSDFKAKSLNEDVQRGLIVPLVKEIQNLAPSSKVDQARIAISLVQNIPYGDSNQTFSFGGQESSYSRYPYEVLYDQEGICGEKSALLAFLLKEIGFGSSIFYFAEENHEAVGISCPADKSLYGSGFCFVETGGPSIISDISIEFEGGVHLDSTPDVLLISEGISLPENLREYSDARALRDIKQNNFFGLLKFWREDNIIQKYDLDGSYNLD